MKIRKKNNDIRVPIMQGRKGNLKSKRYGNKRARRMPIYASPNEIECTRLKNEKIAEIPKFPFN